VLLHGGGQTRHAWRHTARTLAQAGFQALAYDARGHGDSDWVADGHYGEAAMADDLACMLRAAGLARPVLIGASMGGITGLVATGTGVVDASALILADVAHTTAVQGFERVRDFMSRHAAGFTTLQEAAEAVSAYRGAPAAQPAGAGGGLARNLRQGGMASCTGTGTHASWTATGTIWRRARSAWRSACGRWRCPRCWCGVRGPTW
jgi:pimeloyl-ACP methyl ester carboxylesterase